MATLGQIISRMRAAGESEEDIAATRAEYEKINTPKPRPSLFDNQMAGLDLPRGNPEPVEPTDFWGGFKGALTPGGGAFETGLSGLGGYARGAIQDLPSSIAGALRTGAGLMSFGNPQRQVEAGRELFEGLAALPGHIAEAYKFAPTRPEEFGRLHGQLMGQPAAGELAGIGALGAGRTIRRPAANLMSSVGRGLEGAKPVQGMPVTPKGAISSVVRASVAPAGRALQRGGEALRKQALAYEGARAAEGAGIPLKDPIPTTAEGEPMGGGMGITRPRVTRQGPGPTGINQNAEVNRPIADTFEHYPGGPSGRKTTSPPPTIPAEPPPSQVAPGTQPPEVQTFENYPGGTGGPGVVPNDGVNPPPATLDPAAQALRDQTASAFEQPVPSQADPMFLSPLENAGDLATRNRYQNRSMYPERTPRTPEPIGPSPSEVIPESQPPILEDLQSRAARTPESTPSAFTEPVPSEADPIFQSDLETFETNPGGTSNVNTAPSAFPSEPVPISDVDPIFRSEPAPPPGANLVKPSALTPEEEFAAAVEQARAELNQEPSVGFQPDPFSLGEPAPPTQPRVTVKAPKTPRDYEGLSLEELEKELADRKAGKKPAPKKAPEPEAKPEPKAEPPKAEAAPEGVDTTTGEITETTPPPLRAKKLKGRWNLFKSGEPGRTRPYGGYEEGSASIPEWADKVAEFLTRKGRAPKADELVELFRGEHPENAWMRDIHGEQSGRFFTTDKERATNIYGGGKEGGSLFSTKVSKKDLPQYQADLGGAGLENEYLVPESVAQQARGPVSNRSMFERSAQIGAEEAAAARPQSQFSDAVAGANEFSPDLVETPENVLEGASPTFAPRQSFQDIQKRMYELTDKAQAGTLTAEELTEAQALNKVWRNHPEFGGDAPYESIAAARERMGFQPADIPEPPRRPSLFEDERGAVGMDIGPEGKGPKTPSEAKAAGKEATGNLAGRLVKSGEYTRVKAKDVGPRGGAFRVEDPSGKHLGDIVVTPDEVAAMKAHEGGLLEDVPDNSIAQEIYKNKFDEMMEKHGIREDALTRVKVTTKSNRTKNVEDATAPPKAKTKATESEGKVTPDKPGKSVLPPIATPDSYEGMPTTYKLKDPKNTNAVTALRRKGYHLTYNAEGEAIMVRGDLIESETMAKAPETAKAEPAPVKSERSGFDPDKAFAPGGDPEPIREAIFQLRSQGAADARYKFLLPSNKQGPLGKMPDGKPETWQGRVVRMFTEPTPAEVAKKAQVEEFVKSVEATREPARQPRPVEGKVEQVPLLRSKDVKFTPRPVKTVRNSPAAGNKNWISPRQEEMLRQMRKKHGE